MNQKTILEHIPYIDYQGAINLDKLQEKIIQYTLKHHFGLNGDQHRNRKLQKGMNKLVSTVDIEGNRHAKIMERLHKKLELKKQSTA
jgi:hypothetical protein